MAALPRTPAARRHVRAEGNDLVDTTAHRTRTAAPAPPDARLAGLVALLDQLTQRAGATTKAVGDGRDLRQVAWAEQDPYVLRLLAEAARAYLQLDAEHHRVEQARRGLQHLATHDVLTGLPNRTLVLDRLEHALASAARSGGGIAVLFIDIDGFKQINDTLGHAHGDIVLAEIGARLRRTNRDGDTVGRMSGDEFVVVCENLPDTSDEVVDVVRLLARRIADALSCPSPDGLREVVVSASIGAAVSTPAPSAGAAGLLRTADAAMYRSKHAGGGRLTIAGRDPGLHLVRAGAGAIPPPGQEGPA